MGILQKKARARARRAEFDHIHKSTYKWEDLKLREINLKLGEKKGVGTNIEVYLADGLDELYGRKNLCLKIFKNSVDVWGFHGVYGQSVIIESTVVQNLMAIRGLAPRVYDTVRINGKTAQVTDYLEGDGGIPKIQDSRFKFVEHELDKKWNFVAGRLVDFQGAIFRDFPEYKKSVIEKAKTKTSFPRTEKQLYQSTKYHEAKRGTKERLKRYNFPSFKGKNVLDIGCNLGMMMRAAHDLGAKRVVGIDWPDEVEVSRELAILDGYFNLDFVGADIKSCGWGEIVKQSGISYFDVHFFLAMEHWVGWPEWVKTCDTLYYEGHGKVRPYEVFNYKQ